MKYLRAVVPLFFLLLLAAAPASACECGPWRDVVYEFAHSRYVVVAELESVKWVKKDRGSVEVSVFEVPRAFKGKYSVKEKITFRRYGDKSCVWEFGYNAVGKEFLIFVYDKPGKKHASWGPTTCSRTGEMETAHPDIPRLEKLTRGLPHKNR